MKTWQKWTIGAAVVVGGAFLLKKKAQAAALASAPLGEGGTPLLPPSMHPNVVSSNYLNVSTWSSGIIGLSYSKTAADGQVVDRAAYSTIIGDGPSLDPGVPVVLLAELSNPTFRGFYKGTGRLAYSPTPQSSGGGGGGVNWNSIINGVEAAASIVEAFL